MPECRTVRHPISLVPNKKTNDARTVPVLDQAKAVRHLFVWYRTEIIDAGMPMPALVFWMPMPSYGYPS
jgi:hypothetical protein